MKIAVCYSGLPRTILNCLDNHYENLLKDNLCDIYFSFWDTWGFNFREDTLKKEENISNDLRVCLDTVNFVINHMYQELNTFAIYHSKQPDFNINKYYITSIPSKKK